MVDGLVSVSLRVQMPVRPAGSDDRSDVFQPVTNNSHQRVGGSVRNGNEEGLARLALDTAKHSLPFHSVAPVILLPTELAVVHFDSLVTIADLLRAILHVHQHDLFAEVAAISDGIEADLMLLLYNANRYAAHDVISEEHNLHEIEVTLLKS
jgi:hypothetical protein